MKAKLNRKQLLHEAVQQNNALNRLKHWMQYAMLFSSCAMVLTWWGLTGTGIRFGCGIAGAVLATLGVLCAAFIGLGIRNGRRNVKSILNAANVH